MLFESKKDIGVIWIYIGALCGIILGKSVLGAGSFVAVMVIWAVFVAFMITNMYTIRYIITDSELIIKTCMFKKRLKLNRFSTITPVRGGYSFTASSPDQLQLMYLSDTKIRVSPKDVEGFKTGLIMAIKKYKETESANAQ